MKIAITADTHLTSREEHPDRFQTLETLLYQCGKLGVEMLIIAGDLFDHSSPNYADFESIYRHHRPQSLTTHIIPGNHDPGLTDAVLAADDLFVYTKPHLLRDRRSPPLLFVPYRDQATMGEEIAPFKAELPPRRWVLIGHGDWSGGKKYPDPYEPGVYMPLTKTDLELYQPRKAFLGHIHRPSDSPRIHYPGSPSPLDITETGLRRFLIYNTESGKVSPHLVDGPLLYFQESFLVLPLEDEITYLAGQISDRIQSWDLPEGWADKVRIRVDVTGYTRSRSAVQDTVRECFADFQFYKDEGPDLSKLNHGVDPDRARIAQEVKAWLEDLNWPGGPHQPGKDQILAQALKVIYEA